MITDRWASHARQLVRLSGTYPFELSTDVSDENGIPRAGIATHDGRIVMNSLAWQSRKRFLAIYLHEVGHIVARSANIDDDPAGRIHNKYFGVLVATMYRRANLLDHLKVYDFADGLACPDGSTHPQVGEEIADGEALIARFRYIVRRSAQLARSSLTIEAAAEWVFRNDLLPDWAARPSQPAAPGPWWAFWR